MSVAAPVFELNLRRSLQPLRDPADGACYPGTQLPAAALDAQRGLAHHALAPPVA